MFDELKEALQHCSGITECSRCLYFTNKDVCYAAMHKDAATAITKLEKTIAYLLMLNNRLNIELQNSIDLKNYCMKEAPSENNT